MFHNLISDPATMAIFKLKDGLFWIWKDGEFWNVSHIMYNSTWGVKHGTFDSYLYAIAYVNNKMLEGWE